jgi:hypothetical protein
MKRVLGERRNYWIAGTVVAFLGAALVRLISPEIEGALGWVILGAGHILVIAGLTIIVFGTRRRPEDAFVMVDREASPKRRRIWG